jgi:tetratricopeptide (TPR) repeat protein
MASSARIEELERKFNENPRRYFAPLANEYRKAGDLEQAIAICRTYVPQQPAHMSGHIVFGQALFEAGEHEEARGVFEAALALDPENLIALRHLGDIARERGETSAARTWYQRVLDADPRNDEVATLLSALNGPGGREPAGEVPTWAEINPERTLELPPALLESATRETVIAASSPDVAHPAPPGPRNVTSTFAPTLQPPPPAVPAAAWAQETPVGPEDIPAPGLVDMELLAVSAAKGAESGGPVPAGATESPAEPAGARPSVGEEKPSAAADVPAWRDPDATPHEAMETAPADGLEPMEFVAPPHPEAPPAPAVQAPAHDRADDETPAVFVTETMAELYLQQGFRDEALNVYRQLLAQNPADATLQERVEQLERMPQRRDTSPIGAEDTAGSPIEPGRGVAGGLTIRAFFAALATRTWHGTDNGVAQPPSEAEVPAADAVTTVVASHEESSPSHAEPEPEAIGDERATVHDSPEGGEVVQATGVASESPPAEVGDADHAMYAAPPEESGTAPERTSGGSELQITHDTGMDAIGASPGAIGGRVMDDFGYGGGTSVDASGLSEYDVASYDAADMSGSMALPSRPGVSEPMPAMPPAAESVPPPIGEATFAGPAPTPTSERVSEPPGEPQSAEVGDPNGTGPPSLARKAMQTGSVNVLFPQDAVRPTDETAAATLSNAFGGPTQTGVASVTGRPARPASNELSLDSIFREAPPPPEPRREASAFSFDQFFTDAAGPTSGGSPAAPTPGAAQPRDSTADASGADTLSDAEQFSNWLAGLKKK